MTEAVGYPKSNARPFNSPLECGLRMLFVLDAAEGVEADLQRLISYDYLMVHSADVPNGPTSLHPAVPFRGTEMLVKRDLIRAGLNQMFARELLSKTFGKNGITYSSSALTSAFLKLLNTSYASSLSERAAWVVKEFGAMNDAEFNNFISDHIGRWGAEFERITAAAELEL